MTCPVCFEKTRVFGTAPDEDTVYRIRECVSCGYRFCTTEVESDDKKRFGQVRGRNSRANRFKNIMRSIEKGTPRYPEGFSETASINRNDG